MDKENFFQFCDELCSYNIDGYFNNSEWYLESLASQVDIDPTLLKKSSKTVDTILYNLDELQLRKIKFFENLEKSFKNNENKFPNLLMIPFHPLEKNAYNQDILLNNYDFVEHPEQIEKFHKLISTINFSEIYYNTRNKEFNENILNYININLNKESNALIDIKLIMALDSYILLNLYQGEYLILKDFFEKNKENEKFKLYLEKHSTNVNNLFKKLIDSLFIKENNYNIYPILRNYSIIDFYNISKNLLYTSNKNIESVSSTSLCTDGTYLYVILIGICGGLYKIGTGKNGTIKGKVYEINQQLNKSESNPFLIYNKNNDKLYYKTNQSNFGVLLEINPLNLVIENKIKLNFDKSVKSNNIIDKNFNYILLNDDKYVYSIAIEIEEEKKPENKEVGKEKNKDY